ncbi:ABC transporter permease [Natronomonas sp. EA1]|uniref:ABC transporter permease n=1 Tax=Natronomonas sp. EA1 TaxID=3421655 RepID=UPI003EBC37B4
MTRLRAFVGLAVAQLRHHRRQALYAVVGVALAVLLVTLLVGMGYGLFTTGGEAISWIDRDLWISGGTLALTPGVGGVENPIHEAHEVAADIESRPAVTDAQALAFQAVYVSTNKSEFDSVVGVGVSEGNDSKILVDGPGLAPGDPRYANGSYDGPMTHRVIVSREVAERYDVGVNDTLYIGGTLAAARRNPFRVVGVSGSFSTFLGSPTVAMPLAELQTVSGTTGTDPAALIAVNVESSANPDAVAANIERAHPELDARTNEEQVRAIVGGQAAVVAGAITMVVLAVVTGFILVVNVLALLVYQQREELAAVKAAGVRGRSLVAMVVAQGVWLGLAGAVLGLGLTPFAVELVNGVAADLSGFPNLIKTPWWVYGLGGGIAVGMGALGSLVAGWRVARLSPVSVLR